jgi:glutamate/tyrosine decarboxylase-like PLP-dependent enzyme
MRAAVRRAASVLLVCLACVVQVRQMEAEVVAMTAAMLNGGPGTTAPEACGAMTSGACVAGHAKQCCCA